MAPSAPRPDSPGQPDSSGQPDQPDQPDQPVSSGGHQASGQPSIDPVRARRDQVARWTLLANRVGYLLLALAIALFVMAFVIGFTPTMASLVIVTMVAAFVLLAPSIVLGYAVKAAERDDRERGV